MKYNLTLNADYSLEGTIEIVYYDYSAANFRTNFAQYNSNEAFLNAYSENKVGLSVIDFTLNNKDSVIKPLQIIYNVRIDNAVTEVDNELYINPCLFEQMKQNPFNEETRNYPIDFAYKTDRTVTVTIKIPENLTISQLPKAALIKMSDNTAKYQHNVTVNENSIQLYSKFNLDNYIYLQTIYPEFREFFNLIVKKNAELVVLTKKSN